MTTVPAALRHLTAAALISVAVGVALPAQAQGVAAGATGAAAQKAAAAAKPVPQGPRGIIGRIETMTAKHEDTLVDLARTLNVGYVELLAANPGVEPWLPGEGTKITVPTAHLLPDVPREGIVVNMGDLRLYYFPKGGGAPLSFPIGIGREGFATPYGVTRITMKRDGPTWTPTPSMRARNPSLPAFVGPGPNNPLGTHAMNLGWQNYVIHGTNRPYGVGRRVSQGCVRLYPEDIIKLFGMTESGTKVTVIDQPAKVQVIDGQLYLEVHPTQLQVDQIEEVGRFTPEAMPEVEPKVAAAATRAGIKVDWEAVTRAVIERTGLPVKVSVGGGTIPELAALPVNPVRTPVEKTLPGQQSVPAEDGGPARMTPVSATAAPQAPAGSLPKPAVDPRKDPLTAHTFPAELKPAQPIARPAEPANVVTLSVSPAARAAAEARAVQPVAAPTTAPLPAAAAIPPVTANAAPITQPAQPAAIDTRIPRGAPVQLIQPVAD
ncbi:L,D-transpeptidase family protein [Tistrella mobilis]|uniref:L,D-transpeptidase family protein n=1 Tax=Tistrella mobilis TaxID=171437 RepID=UPI003558F6D7